MSMCTCIAVNLPMVIVLPRPVIMFYMIFDLFQHKYNAFYRRGELFPIWATIIGIPTVNSDSWTPSYTVMPSINTDSEGGSDMTKVVWKIC